MDRRLALTFYARPAPQHHGAFPVGALHRGSHLSRQPGGTHLVEPLLDLTGHRPDQSLKRGDQFADANRQQYRCLLVGSDDSVKPCWSRWIQAEIAAMA
jgi:hypothetical protein